MSTETLLSAMQCSDSDSPTFVLLFERIVDDISVFKQKVYDCVRMSEEKRFYNPPNFGFRFFEFEPETHGVILEEILRPVREAPDVSLAVGPS